MNTQIILTYACGHQETFKANLDSDLNKDLRDVADEINDWVICDPDIRKMSFCFMDIKNIDDMKKHKLTRTALKTNGKYYFDNNGQLI